jgi:hypothetical protein
MLRDVPQERDSLSDTRAPESETNRVKATAEQVPGRVLERAPGSTYWLVARNENSRLEVLAIGLAGTEEAIPVFSHEEEAELFLRLWEAGFDVWQARESSAGELISVLCGPCASVERVVLDPLPEMLVERTVGLVSLSRKHFVDLVLSREQRQHEEEPSLRGLANRSGPAQDAQDQGND